MTTLHVPVPLGEFLDAGGDPHAVLGEALYDLIEAIAETPVTTRVRREERAELFRLMVEASVRGEPLVFPLGEGTGKINPRTDQTKVIALAWAADLYADPTLGERVRAALPEDQRAALDRECHRRRSPHPLGVITADEDYWLCWACGVAFGDGEPVMVIRHQVDDEGRIDSEPEPYPRGWCYGCVSLVVETMRAARRRGLSVVERD